MDSGKVDGEGVSLEEFCGGKDWELRGKFFIMGRGQAVGRSGSY